MIRTLRYVLIALLGLVLLTVALANRAPVTVRLLPDDMAAFLGIRHMVDLPLFLVIFAGIVAHRTTASTKSREVTRLERELSVLRDAKGEPQDDILALLDGPRPR
jgi:lipopolysaccharide assembly protein A